jgi:predicted nucleic acid-binding protein
MIVYVDTSAVIKRVVDEPGSDVVTDVWNRADEVVSSDVVYAETRAALAAIRRAGRLDAVGHRCAVCEVEDILGEVRLVKLDETIGTVAGGLADRHALRGFDAIHLAAALSVDAPRIVVTTWDCDLAGAASDCGMPIVPALD